MITELTSEQIKMLDVYREKWKRIGLSCEPCNVPEAKLAVEKCYRLAGIPAPVKYILCDSPFSAVLIASVRDSVRNSVRDSVRASVWDSVWNSVRDSVRDSVRASVWDSVRASVWDSVRELAYGSHDAGCLSYYDYLYQVVGLQCCEPLTGLIDLAQFCGWWAPYRNMAILQHRHCELHKNAQGQLHNPSGLAVKYRDGWGIYRLNGVAVPASIVQTPAELLDPMLVLTESNVEIRREIIRKIGVERLVKKIGGTVVDRWEEYELIEITIPNTEFKKAHYLKMKNPSTGTYHIEGVPPTIKTIQEALSWRIGGLKWTPSQLT